LKQTENKPLKQQKTDQVLFETAKKFLLERIPNEDRKRILDEHLNVPDTSNTPKSLVQLYNRILISAQNAHMMSGVIGKSIGGVDKLAGVLCGFDPTAVWKKYGDDHAALLAEIRQKLNPDGKVLTNKNSLWPKYCKAALSGAAFLNQFEDGKAFYKWANHLYQDEHSVLALPFIIDAEIDGIGFALACDFLKDIGFTGYGKPDVQIKHIFCGVGLISDKASSYQVLKIIRRIAANNGVSPYCVDKLFWLIGSGKLDAHHGIQKLNGLKKEFIAAYRQKTTKTPKP
jgi:hypothetical protein